mmetsp:Transcript_52180/g.144464  ORF Transcript_52180/g.144464 Transcript_52180/m.144464 type:complete len:188 (-) Transcript_52180:144-707(-)
MPVPLLPAVCLYRHTQQSAANAEHHHLECTAGVAASRCSQAAASPLGGASPRLSPVRSPGTCIARRSAPYGSPTTPFSRSLQASPARLHSGLVRSPGSVISYSPGSLGTSEHVVKKLGRGHRCVQFSSPLNTCYDITPYEEIYGKHPDLFNFDASGAMVPPSPGGTPSPMGFPAIAYLCDISPHGGS